MTAPFKLNFKHFPRLLILGFFIVAFSQLGWATCLPIENNDRARFSIREEYLYFRPSFDNDFIAAPNINGQIPFTLQPGGPGKKNQFKSVSGYRLSALYFTSTPHCLIKNIGLRFTYLPAQHSKKISLDSFLAALVVPPVSDTSGIVQPKNTGWITSNHRLNYYATDLFVTLPIFDTCRLSFLVQPGVHYACMSYQSRTHVYQKNSSLVKSASLREKSETQGLGPQLEFTLNYQLQDWLALKGRMKGGLLLSRARAHFDLSSLPENSSISASDAVHPRSLWKVVPFWETNIGLCSSFSVSGYTGEIEIGYEYLTYPDFTNRIQYPSNGSPNKADNIFTTFDFLGPYASLTINF